MLNKEKHQLIMGRILRDIYSDARIASLLGFKGGTCAYFFYNLPRLSVDLDFDLLPTADDATKEKIFEAVKIIMSKYGEVKDSRVKRYTIFFLLSYGDADHNIKIEVNTRMLVSQVKAHYELKEFLGISMLIGKKDYLFASKLAALTARSTTAMRDVYDIWYFANKNWDINTAIVEDLTGKKARAYLSDCIATIGKIKDNEILQGMGELLGDKDKAWVKSRLKKETVFLLKNYQLALQSD